MLEGLECLGNLDSSITSRRKKSKNDKRRFSDEQIRCLEEMFESETKLDPRKKVEVARELGLLPRQVAIWFQNKRARWKSKHIEKEYSLLLADYNALAAQFESLKREKNSLLTQLQKLKNEEGVEERGPKYGSSDGESECIKIVDDLEFRHEMEGMLSVSDDDSNIKAELFQAEDESEFLKMVESTSDWGSLESDDIINQPSQGSCQWWDFWS